jgi:hypothetical protein
MYYLTRGLLRTPPESYLGRKPVLLPNREGGCLARACEPNKPQAHGPDRCCSSAVERLYHGYDVA